MTFKVIALVIA